jgi:hypothetical protein
MMEKFDARKVWEVFIRDYNKNKRRFPWIFPSYEEGVTLFMAVPTIYCSYSFFVFLHQCFDFENLCACVLIIISLNSTLDKRVRNDVTNRTEDCYKRMSTSPVDGLGIDGTSWYS